MQQPPVTNEDVTCFREFQSIYARDQRIADTTIYEIDSRLRKCEELHKMYFARHQMWSMFGMNGIALTMIVPFRYEYEIYSPRQLLRGGPAAILPPRAPLWIRHHVPILHRAKMTVAALLINTRTLHRTWA